MDSKLLLDCTDEEIQAEIARRKQARDALAQVKREWTNTHLHENIGVFMKHIEHSRSSCSDKNRQNAFKRDRVDCPRCFLLEKLYPGNFGEWDISISVHVSKPE